MTGLARARELIGRPVVTLDEAEAVAEVKDVIFSPDRGRLAAFTLNEPGALGSPMEPVLPVDRVDSLGRDAVMISSAETVTKSGAEVEHGESVVGMPVVTEGGNELGTVEDLVFEPGGSYRVVGFEVVDGDERRLVALGSLVGEVGDAIVIASDATTFAHDDIAGFGAAVTSHEGSEVR